MKVYKGIDSFVKCKNAVVTSGTFDGVHLGHRSIIEKINQSAKKINGESVLLTFFPHPRMVLQPDADLKLINSIDERIDLLRSAGIQHLIIQPFTKAFSRISSLEFVRDILVNQIGTSKLVIGYDHHFGRNREGSFEHLKEFGPLYGFEVEEIPAQDIDSVNISSTKIRNALFAGDIATANTYLGSNFTLSGNVVKGNQIGRTLGFATANLQIDSENKLIPAMGVYAVYVNHGNLKYKGMLNIGIRPTLNLAHSETKIEVHLFDFSGDLYGEDIQIEMIQRIREEKKFPDLDALTFEMQKDKVKSLNILK